MSKSRTFFCAIVALSLPLALSADDSPQHQRHELMEDVGDAAKPVGGMLQGEIPFDADAVMNSLEVWARAAAEFGDLFPEGSETGYGTEAKSTIWTDREGFNQVLADWDDAVQAAIAANPQSLDELKMVGGPIFKQCKACHEDYRVEDD